MLIALGPAVSARADLSDSGNLTIGGTGVIQGTMTVQGAEFSVGGTTFSVAGGSVTLGGRLNAAAAGIKWADGSTSTTASAGGGSGNVVLTATQTFSGVNTFTSTTTFGPSGRSNVLDYSRVTKGVWSVVSYSSFTAASTVTFTNINPTYSHRFTLRSHQSGANGFYLLRFNDDSTVGRYAWNVTGQRQENNTAGYSDWNSGASADYFPLQSVVNSNSYVTSGYGIRVTMMIDSDPTDATQVYYNMASTYRSYSSGNNYEETMTGGGVYKGVANLSSMRIGVNAGAMTGFITVEALWNPDVQ